MAPDSALDAAKIASAELGEAREKLAMTDGAVTEENMVSAERFAQEMQCAGDPR